MKSLDRSSCRRALPGLAVVLCVTISGVAAQQASPAPPPAITPASDDLTALLADFRAVSPVEAGIGIHAQAIQIGHLEISIEDGSLFPLRTPKGLTLGFFFERIWSTTATPIISIGHPQKIN